MSILTTALVGMAASGGTAASGGLFGIKGAFDAFTALKGGLGLFGAFSQIKGANQNAAMMESQAQWSEMQGRQETLRGVQEGNIVKKNLIETMAAQNARWGFAGVDVSSGAPVNAQDAAVSEAEQQLGVTRDNAKMNSLARRKKAANLRLSAGSARSGGYGNAALSLLTFSGR